MFDYGSSLVYFNFTFTSIMKCLKCDGEQFEVKLKDMAIYLNNVCINISSECFECQECKSTLMESDQMNELLRKYRMALKEIKPIPE